MAIKDACVKALSQLEGSLMGNEKKKTNKSMNSDEVDTNVDEKGGSSMKTKQKPNEDTDDQVEFFNLFTFKYINFLKCTIW